MKSYEYEHVFSRDISLTNLKNNKSYDKFSNNNKSTTKNKNNIKDSKKKTVNKQPLEITKPNDKS